MKNKTVKTVILETVKTHLGLSLLILLAVLGAVGAGLLPPLVLGKIVDGLAQGAPAPLGWILGYFGLMVLTGLLESGREVLLTVFGQKITRHLRQSLMEKYTCLTTQGLTRLEPGSLVSRLVGDVDTVEELFSTGVVSMFADLCKIISILAVIWVQNRGLSLLLLPVLPGLYLFTRRVQKKTLKAQLENRQAVSRAAGLVPQTLHNIRTVHCLGKEEYMVGQYGKAIEKSYSAMERTNFYDAIYSPVVLGTNAVVVAAVMLLSASGNPRVLTLFGMSAGTAVAVMNYIGQIFAPVESLGMEIQAIQSAAAGIRRIDEFLGWPERAPMEQTPEVPGAPCVELRHVTFGYDEEPVLRDVSMKVESGEQVTIRGRTGAGKSTLLKLLLGLYRPDRGAVLFHGASSIPENRRRQRVGYVEQRFHMVPGTVADQITLWDDRITREQTVKAATLAGLHPAILALPKGYDTPCTPELFSQGQWQLLSIARAVVLEPELLLLDEITANLDAETERQVLEALNAAAENRTVISISHRPQAKTGRVIGL